LWAETEGTKIKKKSLQVSGSLPPNLLHQSVLDILPQLLLPGNQHFLKSSLMILKLPHLKPKVKRGIHFVGLIDGINLFKNLNYLFKKINLKTTSCIF